MAEMKIERPLMEAVRSNDRFFILCSFAAASIPVQSSIIFSATNLFDRASVTDSPTGA